MVVLKTNRRMLSILVSIVSGDAAAEGWPLPSTAARSTR
jgi:hypothetical protein